MKKTINVNETLPKEIIVSEDTEVYNVMLDNSLEVTLILEDNVTATIKNLTLGNSSVKIKVVHKGSNSRSFIEAKNLVKEKSSFVAKTVVEETAHATEARQSINSLLLTPNANITALPILDIKNNDVTASHGTSIGTLDEELLFYMRSRGMNCKQAKEAIIQGYIDPFLKLLTEEQKKLVEAVI